MSTTLILNVAVPVLPRPSEAEQVTVVVPRANVEFRAGAQVTSRGSPRSTAVGEDEIDYRAGKAVRFDSLVGWDTAQDWRRCVDNRDLECFAGTVGVRVRRIAGNCRLPDREGRSRSRRTTRSGDRVVGICGAERVGDRRAAWPSGLGGDVGRHRDHGWRGSATMTWKLVEAEWPPGSLAEQFTVVDPIGNAEPEGGVQLTVTAPATASVAVGFVYVTTVLPPGATFAFTSGAGPKTGGMVSWIVTLNDLLALRPALSVAVQTTVVSPMANVDPDPGTQLTGTEAPRSVAVGLATSQSVRSEMSPPGGCRLARC